MATINGTTGDDNLIGTSEADQINGLAGNDTMRGAGAGDVLNGGSGDDTYVIRTSDLVNEIADNGNDLVFVDVANFGGNSYTATANVEAVSAFDQSGTTAFNITGGTSTVTIAGNAGVNTLTGAGTQAQTLIGLAGNDTYNVSAVGQAVREGANGGNDTLNVNFATFTTAQATAGYVLASDAQVETINLTNAGRITGSASVQTINGSIGNDTIDGGGGADSLAGGAGDDTYSVSLGAFVNDTAGTDRVIASTSYALASGPFTGGATTASGVETLELAGRGATATTVAASNTATTGNYLVGDATAQRLIGDNGDNTLLGKATGDVAGTDTLIGLGGSDTYRVYAQGDVVVEGSTGTTAAAIAATGAFDTVFTSASYSLLVNDTNVAALAAGTVVGTDAATVQQIEVLSMAQQAGVTDSTLEGNGYANTIIGDAGNNTFRTGGGTGVDRLNGLGGDDTFFVDVLGTFIEEAAGGGNDTAIVTVPTVTTTTAGVTTTTFYTLSAGAQVEQIVFNAGGGTVSGNEIAQSIVGSTSNETLIGGGGTDTLNGNGGNDTYRVDSQDDVIVEAVDAAVGDNDTVLVDATFTGSVYALSAGAEIENLRAAPYNGGDPELADRAPGTTGVDLVGNNFAQLITGDNGSNTILGAIDQASTGGVNDTLAGLSGDDIYRVYDDTDVVLEGTGGGDDIVFTNNNFSLLDNAGRATTFGAALPTPITDGPSATNGQIETLSAADQASVTSLTLLGDNGANRIIGNNGDNILGGGLGNDVLIGLGRGDQFYFNEFGAANADTIQDFSAVNGGDRFLLDTDTFTGLDATGGRLADGELVFGTASTGTTAQLIYNQATGQLFYDADGATSSTGAGAQQLIATITPGTQLIASDILLTAATPVI